MSLLLFFCSLSSLIVLLCGTRTRALRSVGLVLFLRVWVLLNFHFLFSVSINGASFLLYFLVLVTTIGDRHSKEKTSEAYRSDLILHKQCAQQRFSV